jgi:F-type H+-transporting ATPase subunit delta
MAEPVTVARPYAEAAFRQARDSQRLALWSDMLALLEAVVRDERVATRLGDPNVDERALEGAILAILGDRVDEPGRNFTTLLVQRGRLGVVPQVRELYEALRREHEGVIDAKVISALPMSEDELKYLLEPMETKYARRIQATVEVDPALISGARVIIGDKLFDATVRGRLDSMAAALSH